jgi:hypothetical protein
MTDEKVDYCGTSNNRVIAGCHGNRVCEGARNMMFLVGKKLLPQLSAIRPRVKLLVGEPPPDATYGWRRALNKRVQRLGRAGNALVTLREDSSASGLGLGAEPGQIGNKSWRIE